MEKLSMLDISAISMRLGSHGCHNGVSGVAVVVEII
jgi:hypothetical protein